jgi:hypothetical protein
VVGGQPLDRIAAIADDLQNLAQAIASAVRGGADPVFDVFFG